MAQEIGTSRGAVIGFVIAGLFIVGLAVVTSKPFQEGKLGLVSHEMASEAGHEGPKSEHEAPAEMADHEPAEAADEAAEAAEAADKAAEAATKKAEAAEAATKQAAVDQAAASADVSGETGECCVVDDMTPPLELAAQVPPGGLHNPYDWKKLVADSPEDYLVKQFRLPGCNECHGGGGGGGMCPALSQGVWFWGNTDDVLFRLIAIGSKKLEEQGFARIQWGTVKAPMPPMGQVIKSSDHMWKIISFIRSINPAGTNPPEKVIPGRYTPPGETKAE